jgi:hypothetical protein
MLARAVWALAVGGQPDGTICDQKARPWAARITRMVLLAAVARGWSPNSPVSPKLRVMFWLSQLAEPLIGCNYLIFDLRRGSPFLTTTRLQTIAAQVATMDSGPENLL